MTRTVTSRTIAAALRRVKSLPQLIDHQHVFDLLLLIGDLGECADPDDCPADLNGDGVVDVFDLLILIGNWG